MDHGLDSKIADIAASNTAALEVFEKLGIDYCCGGWRSLADACAAAGVPVGTALALLERTPAAPAAAESAPESLGSADLMRWIVEKHHRFVREASTRLTVLLAKSAAAHGAAHPEVAETASIFQSLERELSAHMLREEAILFPAFERLIAAPGGQAMAALTPPVRRMMEDHEDAGELLARMRSLTGGYAPPADACPTLTAAYQGLAAFERDLHVHIHLENNVLFPRFQRAS